MFLIALALPSAGRSSQCIGSDRAPFIAIILEWCFRYMDGDKKAAVRGLHLPRKVLQYAVILLGFGWNQLLSTRSDDFSSIVFLLSHLLPAAFIVMPSQSSRKAGIDWRRIQPAAVRQLLQQPWPMWRADDEENCTGDIRYLLLT